MKKEELVRLVASNITRRDVEITVSRFGLSGGRYRSMEEVGEEHGLTREGVRLALLRVKAAIGERAWARIVAEHPRPASSVSIVRKARRLKQALKKYFEKSHGKIDYFAIADKFGFPPSEAAGESPPKSEEDACMMLYIQFGVTFFGKYRICMRHNEGVGGALPLDEFYASPSNAGNRWSICKECNVVRCREWNRKRRAAN